MSDRGAWPVIVARGDDAFYIVFIARGDGEANDVDQKLRAFATHRCRQLRRVKRGDLLRQLLGDGGFGEGGGGHWVSKSIPLISRASGNPVHYSCAGPPLSRGDERQLVSILRGDRQLLGG